MTEASDPVNIERDLEKRWQRVEKWPDGFHLQHRRDDQGRDSTTAPWTDVPGVAPFLRIRDVVAYIRETK
jgi:hypothetical protein